ncbi:MAG: hypothetical protein MZW92_28220 [Comamonadaceae bacterium]|nr:hypothetical protein [Comamonadaceae bacterium]
MCELEFELLSRPADRRCWRWPTRWVERHGLWLDVRTKAERGHRAGASACAARAGAGRGRWCCLGAATPGRAARGDGAVCARTRCCRTPAELAARRRASPSTCTSCASACAGCAPRCACSAAGARRAAARRSEPGCAARSARLGAARDADVLRADAAAGARRRRRRRAGRAARRRRAGAGRRRRRRELRCAAAAAGDRACRWPAAARDGMALRIGRAERWRAERAAVRRRRRALRRARPTPRATGCASACKRLRYGIEFVRRCSRGKPCAACLERA